VLACGFIQLLPIVLVVGKTSEARLPIVAALHDVLRNVRQVESEQAGHLASMRWVEPRVARAGCNGDRTRAWCGVRNEPDPFTDPISHMTPFHTFHSGQLFRDPVVHRAAGGVAGQARLKDRCLAKTARARCHLEYYSA